MFKTLKPTKTLKRILNSMKRKVHVIVKSSHNVQSSCWDGGSRTLTYRLAGNSLYQIDSVSNPFSGAKNPVIDLEPGVILVELGHFCGKEATPALIVSSESDLKGLVNEY